MVALNGTIAPTVHLRSLSDDVLIEDNDEDGSLIVISRWGEIVVEKPAEAVRESLRRMTFGPVALANVRHEHDLPDGTDGIDEVLTILGGSIVCSLGLSDGHGPVLSAVPISASPVFRYADIGPGHSVRLSRFAALRPCNGELAVESPLAGYGVLLHGQVAVIATAALASPRTLAELSVVTGIAPNVARDVVAYLAAVGVVVIDDGDGHFAEETEPAWRPWSVADLRFHRTSRSRQGNFLCEAPPEESSAPPSPALKPAPPGRRFSLPAPAADDVAASMPLGALLETDHTCPDFSGRDLTAHELGHLLYRSARVRGPGPNQPLRGMSHEVTQRPYQSVALLYELEVYLSLWHCADLPRGTYHYDPAAHALTLVNEDLTELGEILDLAKLGAGCVQRPAAMLTLASRMDRLTVLTGAAYRTTLLHAGAFQQTLALVAATLGVAAHPVPVDADDTVDRALTLPWPYEVSVAECVLDRLE